MTKADAVAAMKLGFAHGWAKPQDQKDLVYAATRTAFLQALMKNPLYIQNSGEIQRILAEYDKP